MAERTFKVLRGDRDQAEFVDYTVEVDEGMVVLDGLFEVQAQHANDMAVRWNCKAGKCGSCSMEINGKPRLACMTRLGDFEEDQTITCTPLRTFPVIKDLVTDVSWNYEQNKRIAPFKPGKPGPDGKYRMNQESAERVQEFRKCIECYLCQNVCHVLRDHDRKDKFAGPRFMIRLASLEMHPLDTEDRIPEIKDAFGVQYCNITKCCTHTCPEHIQITDNGIIPLKERVADRAFDPLRILWRKLFGGDLFKDS
ncbi:MAG: succinate dehydrogenase/fumarate reductase iron-sulfur subunit [Saprospiraceae bacterium]|nr:succinate dehydrogenase/fumarate reductase iron-sulfur subunit [Saprospiraceae bacterium]